MPRRSGLRALFWMSAAVAAATLAETVNAQTVWSGLTLSFSKAVSTDPMLPQNQDRITENVWLTRGANAGIYNIRDEMAYDMATFTSPADTEWATGINNSGEEIAASNWEDLTFVPWIDSYGGTLSRTLPETIVSTNAVVHLISDDIYLDLIFTSWSQGGGGFSYMRAIAPTLPILTGDYNGDTVVDAADYVVWRANLGQPVAMDGDGADGNENGTVDPDDYNVWRTNFGRLASSPASAADRTTAVPEPASAAGLLIGLVGLGSCSNRWARRSERCVL